MTRKRVPQERRRARRGVRRDALRRARRHDAPALRSGAGADVDHPVRVLDEVEVVLDEQHRVAPVDEPVQDAQQVRRVLEREARRRLVEDVERLACGALRELARQFDALRLAAAQRRRRLAEPDVAEPHRLERLQLRPDARDVGEELVRLRYGHRQHVGDARVAEADLERVLVVAAALAHLAGDGDVGQELHLDLHVPVALASLAPPALHVEREAPRHIAARLRLRQRREELADGRERARVGGGVAARSPPDRRLVDVYHLVDVVEPVDAAVRARPVLRAVEPLRQRLVQHLVDERGLAGPGDSRYADEAPQRELDVHVAQVVLASALHAQEPAVARTPHGRRRDLAPPRQVRARERRLARLDVVDLALGHDPPAVLAGARPEVDQVVGGAHHGLVVLDDEHRVAEVAQSLQRGDEPLVVRRMQPDRRLVAHVEHAHQAGADLRREADALPLAAAERPRRARERQVFEPHVQQEREARLDLLQYLVGDDELALAERPRVAVGRPARRDVRPLAVALERAHPSRRLRHREAGGLHYRAVGDGYGERLGPEPVAVARLAGERRHIALDLPAHIVGLRLAVAPLEVRDDALVVRLPLEDAPPVRLVPHAHLLPPGVAVEQHPLRPLRDLAPGGEHRHALGVGDAAQHAEVPRCRRPHPRPRMDGAVLEREPVVGHDEVGVDHEAHAEPGADAARSVGAVEREGARLDLGEADAAMRARELLGVHLLRARVGVDREHAPLAVAQRDLHGVRYAAALRLVVEHEPVDDDLDRVPLLLVEVDRLVEAPRLAVDAHADEPRGARLLEQLAVLALLVDDARREQHQPRSPLFEDGGGNLLHRLPLHGTPAVVAVRPPHPRVQQPQVVVDLGYGADRRPRVVGDALLVDGDRGREPLDVLHVRLVHAPEELAGVGGERLDVAPLPLGVDRVERERRLPRPRRPGDDDEPVAGDGYADVLEVVLARAAHNDRFEGHRPASVLRGDSVGRRL